MLPSCANSLDPHLYPLHPPSQGTGVLPVNLSYVTSLTYLSLASNSFSGTLPPSWSALSGARTLTLSSNAVSGPLPNAWSQLVGLQVGTGWKCGEVWEQVGGYLLHSFFS